MGTRGTQPLKEEFRLLEVDHNALQAIQRALQLRREAHNIAASMRKLGDSFLRRPSTSAT
jgi:hypothetical protein